MLYNSVKQYKSYFDKAGLLKSHTDVETFHLTLIFATQACTLKFSDAWQGSAFSNPNYWK